MCEDIRTARNLISSLALHSSTEQKDAHEDLAGQPKMLFNILSMQCEGIFRADTSEQKGFPEATKFENRLVSLTEVKGKMPGMDLAQATFNCPQYKKREIISLH